MFKPNQTKDFELTFQDNKRRHNIDNNDPLSAE